MENKKKIAYRIICFLLIFSFIFIVVNDLFKLVWKNTQNSFYKEPENTIETVFLGSSMTLCGISPIKLYEEYGICSYNLGTAGQPLFASYYWMEEAYRLHNESLKTVVLDVSMLRSASLDAYYRMGIEEMDFSSVKYRAIKEYAKDINEILTYLVPLFSYHNRWSELKREDFGEKYTLDVSWLRGENYLITDNRSTTDTNHILNPDYTVDKNASSIDLDVEALEYFERMVSFCKERSIELILIKTPNPENWSSSAHNTIDILAKEYGLEFLDFNYEPFVYDMDYDYILDSYDGIHLNYYGAQKLALWFGNYLIENNYATNIKNDERYTFLKKQLEEYNSNITEVVQLKECTDYVEYLSLAKQHKNYTIFIVRSSPEAYLSIIEDGTVVHEESSKLDCVSYQGELANGSLFLLESDGNTAKCIINDVSYDCKQKGTNIIVFDNSIQYVIDHAYFE